MGTTTVVIYQDYFLLCQIKKVQLLLLQAYLKIGQISQPMQVFQ